MGNSINTNNAMDFDTFKKEFLGLFRTYMVKKSGVLADPNARTLFRTDLGLRDLITIMNDYTVRYPEYYEQISGEEWTI